MKMNRRLIRTKKVLAEVVINCPLGKNLEHYCRCTCPMRQGNICRYKTVQVEPKCDEIESEDSSHVICMWHFECKHCCQDAVMIVTRTKDLENSQGFCLECGAVYFHKRCEETSEGKKMHHFTVSNPYFKERREKSD